MADRENVINATELLDDFFNEYRAVYDISPHEAWEIIKDTLKEQEAVVHPEPSYEMTYITECCCDLCGVQLIREDNFCRCCGKRIEWEGR